MIRHRIAEPRVRDYRLLAQIRVKAEKLKPLSTVAFQKAASSMRATLRETKNVLAYQNVVNSFAIGCEAMRRTHAKSFYDVQLLCGLALATGSIAEMQTGEGKTITCGLPSLLYGSLGKGVHIATTNDYLARRDFDEMKPFFEEVGLSAGLISRDQPSQEKHQAYSCDITYGTGYEFGFDFLRDQLTLRNQPRVQLGTRFLEKLRSLPNQSPSLLQRKLHFALIDEADSVLIDEAATPLILSGAHRGKPPSPEVYQLAQVVSDQLRPAIDFSVDELTGQISLTDDGWNQIHEQLNLSVQSRLMRPWNRYVENALHARWILKRNVDYVVHEQQIVFVDKNTGRLHKERKWRGGLHQSIESLENIPLTDEQDIEARISRQRYFQFYQRVSGVTGTIQGNEAEMSEFYGLPIVKIPRHRKSRAIRLPTKFFSTASSKFASISKEVGKRRQTQQPILIGTTSIEQSQLLSQLMDENGIAHQVLDGTQDADEAQLISQAGQLGQVTIATNVAGRGTDIRLSPEARSAGGLHVIVAAHQPSSRIDRQLVGRCARQNDPGSFQYFISAEDDFIKKNDPQLAERIRRTATKSNGLSTRLESQIQQLQFRVEKKHFLARRRMLVHDNWFETVQETAAKRAS